MYLFFDTETNGKPKDYKAPMQDVDNWPRVAQLAWQVYDKDGVLVSEYESLIIPDNWEIPKESFFIDNNMSTERCFENGKPINEVLSLFIADLNKCDFMIAHNFQFDYNIVGAEMIRQRLKADKKLKGICTMNSTTNYCAIPGNFGSYKWPKLEELYRKLFEIEIENAHDALGDVRSTALCFFELVKREVIKL